MIIQDNIIKAEECKLLVYTPTGELWGKAARLSVYNGRQLTEDDFEEVDDSEFECIDKVWYDFRGKSYAHIKTFIIKLHYSNDDQIAIMLNNEIDMSGEATDRYREMQEWREYASSIAKKYTEKQ